MKHEPLKESDWWIHEIEEQSEKPDIIIRCIKEERFIELIKGLKEEIFDNEVKFKSIRGSYIETNKLNEIIDKRLGTGGKEDEERHNM